MFCLISQDIYIEEDLFQATVRPRFVVVLYQALASISATVVKTAKLKGENAEIESREYYVWRLAGIRHDVKARNQMNLGARVR